MQRNMFDLPKDGLYGLKGGASQNNEYLWLHVQLAELNMV